MIKADRINYCLLLIISGLFVFNLFISQGEPATMDGRIHITSIVSFAEALAQGQFPVVWFNNFANYGLPVGIFSHQIPLYLGALLEMVTHTPILSMNLMTFVGIVLANCLFYYFLRLSVSPFSALVGSLLFSLAPYRILNVYIRGAMPETFSLFFLPLILICLYSLYHKKNISAFFFLVLSFAGLALTHPMMFIIYSIFIIPYGIYLLTSPPKTKKRALFVRLGLFVSSLFFGVGLASYYLLPLLIEKKYFYFGKATNLLTDNFLGIQNFLGTNWSYFSESEIFTRGHILQVGLPELLIFITGIVFLFFTARNKKQDSHFNLLVLSVSVGIISLFLMTPFAKNIYSLVSVLQNIQFPWRMMSVFIFIPAIIVALIAERVRMKWIFIIFIFLIAFLRFPQLYGKNYTLHSYEYYSKTLENLHSINMNTIWTGKTEEYPVRKEQATIIEGQGKLTVIHSSNTERQYHVSGTTPLRLVDYTFYFPGWKVLVDQQELPIEFQDPDYRGVITYRVPAGEHTIQVIFTDTSVRRFAKIISLGFVGIMILLFILRKPFKERISRYV